MRGTELFSPEQLQSIGGNRHNNGQTGVALY